MKFYEKDRQDLAGSPTDEKQITKGEALKLLSKHCKGAETLLLLSSRLKPIITPTKAIWMEK